LSVNPTPVNATVGFGFVIVNDNVVVPFKATVGPVNALLIPGGATTVMFAFAVFPVPPSFDVTVTLLVIAAAIIPVTFSVIVHIPFAGIVPPVSDTVPDAAVAVTDPPHMPPSPFGVATTRPAGKVSVNATPVSPTALGLVIVKLSVVVPPSGIVGAPNILLIVAGLSTVTLAEAVFPVPPFVDVTAVVVLLLSPDVVPVTVTKNVQVPPAGIVAPASVIKLLVLTDNVPPH
jgi:hypothetical protein